MSGSDLREPAVRREDQQASGEPEAADLRLVPAALAAWAGMWLASSGQPSLVTLGVLGGAAALLVGWRRVSWPLVAVGMVLIGCQAAAGVRVWQAEQDPVRLLATQAAVAVVEVRLTGGIRAGQGEGHRPDWWAGDAVLSKVDGRGRAYLSGGVVTVMASGSQVAAWQAVAPGSVVRATVRLAVEPEAGRALAVARAREPPVVVAPPSVADAAVERVRQGLRDAVAGLDPDPRGLVPALVVGDTTAMPNDLVEHFRATGLTHLTAVSGANLTLLLASLSLGARWLGLRGWWLRGLLVLGVLGFVALCRAEPSVVRAAAMGLAGLAALGMGRRGISQGIRLLCVAVVGVLLLDPWMARSLGFTLSVLASAGIIWWARRWTDSLASWLPRPVAEACCVPLAAQLATQPVVTAISGQISVVGLLANMVAGPLVGPATVLGFAAAALSVIWLPIAGLLAWLAGWCAQGLCWIARLGELVPGAVMTWPTTPWALVVVAGGCFAGAMLVPRLLRVRWLCLGVALVLVVVLLRPPTQPGWPPPDWQLVACDVGQGDAIALRSGPQEAVLVDVGPEPDAVADCLTGLGIRRVPLVVLTHFHADHVAGLGGLGPLGIEHLVISAVTSPSYGYQGVLATAPLARRTIAQVGTEIVIGDVQLTFLAARPLLASTGDEGESAAENDASLVLRARIGDLTVLLAGDVQEAGQEHALRTAGDLGVDVLVVPHHGSGHQLPAFLAASRARIAVFSVGAGNDYGHPAPRIVRLVQELGMTVARTDQQGSVGLRRRGPELLLTVQR